MKLIKNDSLQAFTIFLNSDKGVVEKWLKPGESLVVPETFITEQIKNLQKRRLFKITNA